MSRPGMSPDIFSVFKAYDIRGFSPSVINSHFSLCLGKILASKFPARRVLVGRDMRLTSPELEQALIQGLREAGAGGIIRIGLCSTPMFNVLIHLAQGAVDFGVMVTASHNPGVYNGFKITLGDGRPVGKGSGMEDLREAFLAAYPAVEQAPLPVFSSEHVVDDAGALARYVEHVIQLAHLPFEMPRIKVAIDIGNGMAGAVIPEMLKRLPWIEAILLYPELDGNFPNHEANPLKIETLAELRRVVVAEKCDLGIAFDGDADRIGFVDEKGEIVQGDLLTALLAQELLAEYPGSMVHADIRSSWCVGEVVAEQGGRFEMCQVGHAMIKQLMRKTQAVFAGEVSMHFYYRDLGNFESGDYTMLLILRRLVREGLRMSEVVAPLRRYAKSEEINYTVIEAQAKISALLGRYAGQASTVSTLDGIRLEFRHTKDPKQDWWFNVRASNTEPLLRLNLEARTPMVLAERLTELDSFIRL